MILSARLDGPDGAPPLVLLGSVGSTTQMWTPIMAPLVEQFRVVRIDHRGHGGSAASHPAAAPSIDALATDVLETLDQLGIERAHFAGLSLGGMVAMWLAIHRPDRVRRLVLLCTSARLGPEQSWRDRASAVRNGGMGAVVDVVVARWVTPGLGARDTDLMAGLRSMVSSADAESYAQCCEAIATMDQRADLGRIAAPTLAIAGAEDPVTTPDHLRTIVSGIDGARLHVLDGAAHVPTVERPARVAALMLDHLRAGATYESGLRVRREVLGVEHVARSLAAGRPATAPFQEFLTRYAWGEIWSRPELSRRDRSLATLAVLAALGAEHELTMHVAAARRNGLSNTEIVEVLMHTALYAGLPRANRAIALAQGVLDPVEREVEGGAP